jgi:hypothetical protein
MLGLISTLAISHKPPDPRDHTQLLAISLFVLSGVLLAVFLAWVLGLRLPRNKPGVDGDLTDSDQAVATNAELIVELLRAATPRELTEGNWLAWLHEDPEDPNVSASEDLERYLTVLRNVYEDALTAAPADGNIYLALARSHCLIRSLVEDLALVCARVDKVQSDACTRDQATIISTRTTMLVATLLGTFGGALFAAFGH